MHGRFPLGSACALAVAVVCGLAAATTAQQPLLPADAGYGTALDMADSPPVYNATNPDYYPVANTTVADDQALADRVADLESALASIKDKEAAAKKKAAGKPSVTVGGRVYADTALFSGDALDAGNWAEDTENGTKFRTARLGAKGGMFDVFKWGIEMDFASTDGGMQQTAFKDVYLQMTDLPLLQTLKIGHFKEAASLEELTSSRNITFIERSVMNAFIPARNMGVQAAGHNELETATFAIGFFRDMGDKPPVSDNQDGGNSLTMRGTWLPWYDEATEGRGLLHVGAFYSYRDVDSDGLRIRQRPANSFSDRIVDTATMADAANWHVLGLELAFVYGPFSVQSEYAKAYVHRSATADPDFDAMYVETSYWLTGENRVYKRTSGTFDRVKPFENFFRVRDENGNIFMGKGAWQLAYRFGYIDLIDATVDGGRADVHTMGVNWHLTPYSRLMANYIYADRNGDDESNLEAVTMRAQFDF